MAKQQTYNILFCGLGGQGVLRASEVCSWAAVYAGFHVKKSEVHGMAQRGGFVESHVRFGKKVFSPLIPAGGADFLVSFHHFSVEDQAKIRLFLKRGGVDLNSRLSEALAAVSDRRYVNTYLLGVLACSLAIAKEHWLRALRTVFAGKNIDENERIFQLGYAASRT